VCSQYDSPWPEGKIDWCWFGYTCSIAALDVALDRVSTWDQSKCDYPIDPVQWKWRYVSYKECLMSQTGWWDQNMARRFKNNFFPPA
jgi:hypothetical protein